MSLTAREILDNARRERARCADALDRKDLIVAADHVFNLAVTVLSVRDWIIGTAPAYKQDAYAFVEQEPVIARLVDAANISKHHTLRNSAKSDPPIIGQSFTSVGPGALAELDMTQYYGESPDEAKDAVITADPSIGVVKRTKAKATLADGSRFFHLDDADAAIAAWDKFLTAATL
jgi:hypothetical protein